MLFKNHPLGELVDVNALTRRDDVFCYWYIMSVMYKYFYMHILLIVSFLALFAFYSSFDTAENDNNKREIFAQLIPQDPRYSEQKNTLDKIQLESAWEITTGAEREIIVAVIDDAIDISHPDLKDNLIAGYDFVDGDTDPSPESCIDPVT